MKVNEVKFINKTTLPAQELEAVKTQYVELVDDYANASDIVHVTITVLVIGQLDETYAQCETLTRTGSTYLDHFML